MSVENNTNQQQQQEIFKVKKDFPTFVFNNIIGSRKSSTYRNEVNELSKFFSIYQLGASFNPEGTNGGYVASNIRFKKIKTLIDKEARFMFSQTPQININQITVEGEEQNEIEKQLCENLQKAVNEVLKKSKFSSMLLQSAKDCFIGKRIACLVDYSDEGGVLLHFYNSLQFHYETKYGTDIITRFISFECVEDSEYISDKLFLVNVYEMEGQNVYVSETLYNGSGVEEEVLIPRTLTNLTEIPVCVIVNDATLLNKRKGTSEVESLQYHESGYSRLSNGDIDSERKGMNPIRYTVDMNSETTKNLPSGAGSYWDLQHDMNIEDPSPSVGTLAPQMNHVEAVKATLERIDNSMHEELDIPNINMETMSGTITSGKALIVLYYPLIVRCDEKFKVWSPALETLAEHIIKFLLLNSERCQVLYNVSELREVPYNIDIVEKYALPDDEQEEKEIDINEVVNKVRSIKSYLKKHRKELTTDKQIEEELLQIAMEGNMMDAITNPQLKSAIDCQQTQQNLDDDIDDVKTQSQLEGE